MPAPVSRKQWRYMQALLHGNKSGTSSRGDRAPKSIASNYVGHGKKGGQDGLPESKGKEQDGGRWDEDSHKKHKETVEEKRHERKKRKAALRKCFEDHFHGRAAACIVVSEGEGQILTGFNSKTGLLEIPGGHVEINETVDVEGLNPSG